MAVKLIKMPLSDYEHYMADAIQNYADDKIKANTWNENEAYELSVASFKKLLPQGIHTQHEYLFSVIEDPTREHIGFLWFHLEQGNGEPKLFVYDLIIFEAYRAMGYGKKTLVALDEKAQSMKVKYIGLHVFAHNKTAFHLYEQAGYKITDITMGKNIEPPM